MSARPVGRIYRLLINIIAFQIGWTVAVLLGNLPALLFVACYLPLHGWLLVTDRREWWIIAGVSVAGIIVDSLVATAGVLQTGAGTQLIPLWLMALWILFATTLSHALYWLNSRLLLAAVCGAVAGPFAYFVGARLSDVGLGEPLWQSLLTLSLVWAAFFPLAMRAARWAYENI